MTTLILTMTFIHNDILNGKISSAEIRKAIWKCNNSKAESQQDYIYNEYLKSTKHIMTSIYCDYFYKIVNSGILPDSWLI
jgi:hypothetical protein